MLRGRCSCAISEVPTPSPFALPSLFRLLSPIIPLHRRHSPVTPLFPLHTQKQGGGGHFSAHGQMPASITLKLCYCMLHATQMQNVGAPTYFFPDRNARNQQLADRGTVSTSLCRLLAGGCGPLSSPRPAPAHLLPLALTPPRFRYRVPALGSYPVFPKRRRGGKNVAP